MIRTKSVIIMRQRKAVVCSYRQAYMMDKYTPNQRLSTMTLPNDNFKSCWEIHSSIWKFVRIVKPIFDCMNCSTILYLLTIENDNFLYPRSAAHNVIINCHALSSINGATLLNLALNKSLANYLDFMKLKPILRIAP